MEGQVIGQVELLDTLYFVRRKNKRFLANLMHELEETLGKDDPRFPIIRKLILDGFNEYTRSILDIIFGSDLESTK
jgi:hypothetical protein